MELNLIALGAALAMQVALAPCTIEGVAGPARCGSYQVWEDRAAKAGRQIELSVIVLSSLEAARSDPFFMLQGGPGDAPSFNARFYSRVFQDIRRTHDLVLIDLRGTGADHRRPTLSAVPSFLLSGELDPVTPPSFGEEVARGLTNGQHVVIRNNGHPIGNAERCIGQMIGEFLDRGSATGIDVSCAAAVPAPSFVLPGRDQ